MIDERTLAIDGWMSDEELTWLAYMAALLPPNALVVEIGSWLGRSASAIWLGSGGKVRLLCIDTWEGKPEQHTDEERKFLAETDIRKGFLANMKNIGASPMPVTTIPTSPGMYYITGSSMMATT